MTSLLMIVRRTYLLHTYSTMHLIATVLGMMLLKQTENVMFVIQQVWNNANTAA